MGVFGHLLRHGGRYDVVHTASFPYFSLLAAAAIRPLRDYRIVVDWIEIWTRDYWRDYLGRIGGAVGWQVQRLCTRTRHRAFALSRMHAERLRGLGFGGEVTVLDGLYAGPLEPPVVPSAPDPLVVFAGRHIPEKQVAAIVPAVVEARSRVPGLRAEIFGDGPDRPRLLDEIERRGLTDVVEAPGFVEGDRVASALRRALCLLLPSRREGYGLVVIEAAAVGTPSIVVAGDDNAASELVNDGENGVLAGSADAPELAAAIVRVHELGAELRRSTADWFRRNAARLSLESSLETVLRSYGEG
jgi:glycosyltransferase involved in cell wall biosynthesis